MTLTTSQWHQRYLQQARWTQKIRAYLYDKSRIHSAQRILDVGCGTGVMEHEFFQYSRAQIFGIDLDLQSLKFAKQYAAQSIYANTDCLALPFPIATFDITLCHFLLLWIPNVEHAIAEMCRVTRPRGVVLALAEPDYGGRIDFPEELGQIDDWQTDALKSQGADPLIGRRLRAIFSRAGLVNIEAGVLGGQWRKDDQEQEFELEWQVLESDLVDNAVFRQQAEELKALERSARQDQHRILFVPVFYAFGVVPE